MERRKFLRYQQAVKVLCQIQGEYFEAQTHDLSPQGLTIITANEIPLGTLFHVRCSLESGRETLLEVEERQRRYVHRGSLRYLRLGLHITQASPSSPDFFRELANLVQSRQVDNSQKAPRLKDRIHRRIQFQLPVRARVESRVYKCQTFDIGSRGASILVPPDFPDDETFDLIIEDPVGGLIPLKVKTVYRELVMAPRSGYRIGVKAISGTAAFHQFLKRHDLISQ